jgi:hypothetical protein
MLHIRYISNESPVLQTVVGICQNTLSNIAINLFDSANLASLHPSQAHTFCSCIDHSL